MNLKQIEQKLSQLPGMVAAMKRSIAEQFAEFVRAELVKQHYSGRDLYGKSYPRPKRGGQPMLDTGELAGGYEVRVVGDKVHVDNVSSHTIVNHDGKHIHLPDERGMPESWRRKLEQISRAEQRRLLADIRRK